jgi:hypothetical protein
MSQGICATRPKFLVKIFEKYIAVHCFAGWGERTGSKLNLGQTARFVQPDIGVILGFCVM